MFGFGRKKMTKYQMTWSKDNIKVECYAHQVTNFRYHWHQDDFELNILLHGKQHFFQGTDVYDLEENDVVLINPNVGHASYCDPEGTIALILHFSSDSLKKIMKNGQKLRFLNCHSDQENRNDLSYKRIRMYTAQIQYYLYRGDPFSMYAAKASMEMLMATLCTMFDTREDRSGQEVDEETQEIMKTVIRYLDVHYPEKITLEEIAGMTGYNRTYISTLFHQTLGIRFYDYLMRLRLQKAIKELVTTDKPLTEIALYNGFSDLKSFNTRFREMLKILPSEYRMKMDQSLVSPEYYDILSIPASEPLIMGKLEEYMKI